MDKMLAVMVISRCAEVGLYVQVPPADLQKLLNLLH